MQRFWRPAGALRSAGGVAAPTSEDGGRAAIGAGGSPQKQKQHAKRTSRRPTFAIMRGRTHAPKGGCAVLCLQGWRTEGWAADAPCSWLMRARKSLLWLRQTRCMARVKHVLSRETTFLGIALCVGCAAGAWESCIVVTPSHAERSQANARESAQAFKGGTGLSRRTSRGYIKIGKNATTGAQAHFMPVCAE